MSQAGASRRVLVPAPRVVRWFDNFGTRHGSFTLRVSDGGLDAVGADGATARAELPFDRSYDGPPDAAGFADSAREPLRWGLLLVRRGGFAVAGGAGDQVAVHKIGRRHVQGQTKAGGWSQQRYARRRDNQAREAFDAAAGHAVRLLVDELGGVDALVTGGDRAAVDAVLADPRLAQPARRRTSLHLAVGDPDRKILDAAVRDALSAVVTVTDPQM